MVPRVTNLASGRQALPVGSTFTVAGALKDSLLDSVKLHLLSGGPIPTNAYLLTSSARGEAVLIDAPGGLWADIEPILIETPEVMKAFAGQEFKLEPLKVDHWLDVGEKLPALGAAAEVRWVPGHCPGNVLFYFKDQSAAFVGDALFKGSIGRTDLPGGSFETLARSIREQIYSLPDATKVYSGHGSPTTVGEEKKNNPYVRAE